MTGVELLVAASFGMLAFLVARAIHHDLVRARAERMLARLIASGKLTSVDLVRRDKEVDQ